MLLFYLVLLRFTHVIASVCWAGGAFIFFWFVEPTAKALVPNGAQFVQYMINKRRYNVFMGITSTLTVLSGALLLWKLTNGQLSPYVKTGPGLGFVLGSLFGIAVYFVGLFGIMPRANQLGKIGAQVQSVGGGPTPEQGSQLLKLDREMSILSRIDFWFVALSLAFMATARYWLF